jgi:hypothetical protein
MGTHSELLRAKGHYYKLYTQQFRQETTVEEVAREMEIKPPALLALAGL